MVWNQSVRPFWECNFGKCVLWPFCGPCDRHKILTMADAWGHDFIAEISKGILGHFMAYKMVLDPWTHNNHFDVFIQKMIKHVHSCNWNCWRKTKAILSSFPLPRTQLKVRVSRYHFVEQTVSIVLSGRFLKLLLMQLPQTNEVAILLLTMCWQSFCKSKHPNAQQRNAQCPKAPSAWVRTLLSGGTGQLKFLWANCDNHNLAHHKTQIHFLQNGKCLGTIASLQTGYLVFAHQWRIRNIFKTTKYAPLKTSTE